jgi:UDP-N-acetylmuramyl pentapeptide phosphotransferase/UDP-N-acetylglucosamine-1-phosphate transferase
MAAFYSGLAVSCAVALGATLAACSLLRAFSLRRNLLDRPNERSLHNVPVSRLGGVAIASAIWLALLTLHTLRGSVPGKLELAWLMTSLPIATLGLVDDIRPLRASTRLLLQFSVAGVFCVVAGIPRGVSLVVSSTMVLPPLISLVFWTFFIVAVLNIFNFMDGMDGLAATQALGAALSIGGVLFLRHQLQLAALCAVTAAASVGFLFRNYPPAKIFMGDAGSTFLGFSFASLAVMGADIEPGVPLTVVVLGLAPFLSDGTFTLLRRGFRRETVWKAHRTHLYQRAVTAGLTHREVLVRYALWIVCGGAAAVYASGAALWAMVALFGGALCALCFAVVWVGCLERRSVQTSPDSRIQATSSASAVAKST